jgi:hypothetical protein
MTIQGWLRLKVLTTSDRGGIYDNVSNKERGIGGKGSHFYSLVQITLEVHNG